jgi:DNA polymerase V
MYDYNLLEERDVLCIDQKSFFASVSCLQKGLDPMETKLAVVADTKHQGSVVLAATPALKALGIKTGSRLFEIPHRNDIYIINPSMRKYLEVSVKISQIKLNKRGIFTIGDLANYPYQYLKRDLGIVGVDLHLHANGIDHSKIREKYTAGNPSICKSQILMRDYKYEETKVVMKELIEDVASRVRARNQLARTIHFSFGYSDEGGVSKQYTLGSPTNLENDIIAVVDKFADQLCDKSALYRTLSISLTNFVDEHNRQLDLFIDEYERRRTEKLAKTIDNLHNKYGKGIVSRAVSYTDAGTKHGRLGLMAGHKM